jgi:hypothetical protein
MQDPGSINNAYGLITSGLLTDLRPQGAECLSLAISLLEIITAVAYGEAAILPRGDLDPLALAFFRRHIGDEPLGPVVRRAIPRNEMPLLQVGQAGRIVDGPATAFTSRSACHRMAGSPSSNHRSTEFAAI